MRLKHTAALVLIALVGTSGCDSTEVHPFLKSDQYFSIYGSIDMQLTTQFLRVVPIDTLFEKEDSGPLDAVVTTTDLETNLTEVWRDSLITFSDGSVGHVYMSNFRISAGHTYRVEVTRSDGAVTWAETTVPEEPKAEVGDATLLTPPEAAFPLGSQSIFWRGLTREPHRVDVFYRYKSIPENPFVDVRIPYNTENTSDDPAGWGITVNYTLDRDTLNQEIGNVGLRMAGVAMQVVVLAEDWVAPEGVFDPEVLSQPGVFSNVNNGFGFVGSAGRYSVEWIPWEHTDNTADLGETSDAARPPNPS